MNKIVTISREFGSGGLSKNYTISLNSSEIGYEKCIDIIEELYKMHM